MFKSCFGFEVCGVGQQLQKKMIFYVVLSTQLKFLGVKYPVEVKIVWNYWRILFKKGVVCNLLSCKCCRPMSTRTNTLQTMMTGYDTVLATVNVVSLEVVSLVRGVRTHYFYRLQYIWYGHYNILGSARFRSLDWKWTTYW